MPGMQSHPASETDNPLVDMQAMSVSPKLNDPGIGLRNNGRKVLTYADLKSRFEDPDGREPGRTIELHLTYHMEKFAWSFNGIKFSDAAPVLLKYGERLRITLINDTMMTHPIHLHGMWSDLEDENGNFMVRKHTIDVPPGTKRSYRVTADALEVAGRITAICSITWKWECFVKSGWRNDANEEKFEGHTCSGRRFVYLTAFYCGGLRLCRSPRRARHVCHADASR